MPKFTHLHNHTEYSLLDGACRIGLMVETAKKMGLESLAITDHGALYGIIDFYKACKKEGIKPIIGCEVYTAARAMHDKDPKADANQGHLVLLAKNQEGYRNLMKIVSQGFVEGFYYKPRVDMGLLEKYSKGIIALSACIAGDIPRLILENKPEQGRERAMQYKKIFSDGFYIELQRHGMPEEKRVEGELISIGRELEIPLVATNDAHYIKKEDAQIHDILLCIGTNKKLSDPPKDQDPKGGRMKFFNDEFYFKSPNEMGELFHDLPEALENTVKIADECDVEFDFSQRHLPEFPIPQGMTPGEYLKKLCYEKLPNRYHNISEKIKGRLDFELNVIDEMGFSAYFLIVWDFVRYARENSIMVGPGMGSAAGSLVSYVLEITNIDPLRFGLFFERFLNPERVSMPDIDIDFDDERRDEVIEYVAKQYGSEKVAQIITFGTMGARGSIRDVARVLNIDYGTTDKLAKLIPAGPGVTLSKSFEEVSEIKQWYEKDENIKKLWDIASFVEGMPRHTSIHAAGVVICKDDVQSYVPLARSKGTIVTQFYKDIVSDDLGLLKMDFLGLRTLTVIRDTVALIEKSSDVQIDPDDLRENDEKTMNLFCQALTSGVFQFESQGMRNLLRDFRPSTIDDLTLLVAAYRPGPMEFIPSMTARKHGNEKVTYKHPKLKPILEQTYGTYIYQEQVMQIARDLAGFSLGQGDMFRRAMAKKDAEKMKEQEEKFISGCVNNGVNKKTAKEIFEPIKPFAGYAFNKSHAAVYAYVAYQTAYLKCHYPVEFMTALMTSVKGTSEKVAYYIAECSKMGVEVLPPDVNESEVDFTVVGDKIRFGLSAVKNVGESAAVEIVKACKSHGPFESLFDFCQETRVNKKVVESLIKCGALDNLGKRAQLLQALPNILQQVHSSQKVNANQMSLFDLADPEELGVSTKEELPDVEEFPADELLQMEKDCLGLYVSGHPLDQYRGTLEAHKAHSYASLSEVPHKENVVVGGIIQSVDNYTSRKGDSFAIINIEDFTGVIKVCVWPRVYEKYKNYLSIDKVIVVKGANMSNIPGDSMDEAQQSVKGDDSRSDLAAEVHADEIIPLKKDVVANLPQEHRGLFATVSNGDAHVLPRIKNVIQKFNGKTPFYINLSTENKVLLVGREFWVSDKEELITKLEEVVGYGNVEKKKIIIDSLTTEY